MFIYEIATRSKISEKLNGCLQGTPTKSQTTNSHQRNRWAKIQDDKSQLDNNSNNEIPDSELKNEKIPHENITGDKIPKSL